MASTMALSALRTAVRQRSDMETSQFVSDTEINSYINQSYFELYDLLVQKFGDNYYVASPVTFTTDGSSFQYALPDGTLYSAAPALYKLLGVDLSLTGAANSYVTLKPFNFSDRNRYSVPNTQTYAGLTNLRYRLNGGNLWLSPTPAANQTIQLWYVPRMTQLVADTDTCDGVSGWTEFIIIDAAIKCLQKEESDVSVLMAQKADMVRRIEAAAANRDAAFPATVADVTASDDSLPNWQGGYGPA